MEIVLEVKVDGESVGLITARMAPNPSTDDIPELVAFFCRLTQHTLHEIAVEREKERG